jgi:opacity protein-like surface antigen
MRTSLRVVAVLAVLLAGRQSWVEAQSLQRLSFQASGAVLFATTDDPNFTSKTRLGWEAQLRYTFGRFSLGAGYQRSTVFSFQGNPLSIALSLGFIEPRYVVVAKTPVAVYLAGRVGVGKLVCSACSSQSTNVTLGGGGGLLFKLSHRVSADLGAQYFRLTGDLASGYAMLRAGLGVGL